MFNKYIFSTGMTLALLTDLPCTFAQREMPICIKSQTYKKMQNKALSEINKNNTAEALHLFMKSYEICADSRVLYNIAKTFQKLGRSPEALSYYQKYVDQIHTDSKAEDKIAIQEAREYLGQNKVDENRISNELPKIPGLMTFSVINSASSPSRPFYFGTESRVLPISSNNMSSMPVRTKWLLWTIVGGVLTASIIGGVTGGVIASQILPGTSIDPFGQQMQGLGVKR